MTAQYPTLAAKRTGTHPQWELTLHGGGWDGPFPGNQTFILLDENENAIHTFELSKILTGFDRFSSFTTAGADWNDCRLIYLWKDRWVIICPWWNQRAIISLQDKNVESDGFLLAETLAWERQLILATLQESLGQFKNGVQEPDENFHTDQQMISVSAAMHFAGLFLIEAAIPLLQELEQQPWSWDLEGSKSKEYHRRRIAQIALRRLGVLPQSPPAVQMKSLPIHHLTDPQRHNAAMDLRVGLTMKQVIASMGHPDFFHDELRYDIDNEGDSYSLVVEFKGKRVQRARSFSPPLWHGSAIFRQEDPPHLTADTSCYGMEDEHFLGTIMELTDAPTE